jgi:hypothetical protein
VRKWCKRRADTLANHFAGATVALIVVVCFQAAMLHTQGWQLEGGALLTLVGTLTGGVGGFALTHWSQRWLYRRQLSDQHRLEMRESIASVLDASAALHNVKRLVHHTGEVNKDHEAGKYDAGLPCVQVTGPPARRVRRSSRPPLFEYHTQPQEGRWCQNGPRQQGDHDDVARGHGSSGWYSRHL